MKKLYAGHMNKIYMATGHMNKADYLGYTVQKKVN